MPIPHVSGVGGWKARAFPLSRAGRGFMGHTPPGMVLVIRGVLVFGLLGVLAQSAWLCSDRLVTRN